MAFSRNTRPIDPNRAERITKKIFNIRITNYTTSCYKCQILFLKSEVKKSCQGAGGASRL